MSWFKWTRGPWRAVMSHDDVPRSDERLLEICCLPHPDFDAIYVFAPADDRGQLGAPDYEEFEANARLIAAAPDLAEAAANALLELQILAAIAAHEARKRGPWAGLEERIQNRIRELDRALLRATGNYHNRIGRKDDGR